MRTISTVASLLQTSLLLSLLSAVVPQGCRALPSMSAFGEGEGSERGYDLQQTLLVIEFVRNAARAHNEDNVDTEEYFGVPKNHLT